MRQLILQDRNVTYLEITFDCQKNLFALDPTQFVNRSKKKTRVDWSKEMLQKYDRGASKHVDDIVYESESKEQLTVWVF